VRPARILIRADASPAIGLGHVMRCLALAEVCGERATFLTSEPPPAFVARAAAIGAAIRLLRASPATSDDLRETSAVARATGADWIVLDGYGFDGDFQAGLVADGHRVLAIDDHGHADRYEAQAILNANADADASSYEDRAPGTRLLLGLRFALLRAEFRDWPHARPPAPARPRRLVVTFGGSDPDNASGRVLGELAAVPGPLEILLLVGSANPHGPTLREAAARSPHPVQIAADVRDMAEHLAGCDLAVTAAGGTLVELVRVGTPAIAIVVADNQEPGAAALAQAGAVVNLGRHAHLHAGAIGAAVVSLAHDAVRREALSRRGRELVDGQGAVRVLDAMHELAATGVATR
jgi:UDP-2,4-diacetamido-2,4,6-trideoxy-beta-L-altropyranose hydrolase